MANESTYRELLAQAIAAEFGAAANSLGERELVAAQVIVDRRWQARWRAEALDRATADRPVFTGDLHGVLRVLGCRWHPTLTTLTLPD